MVKIPIAFSYNGVVYSAQVHRIITTRIEYHVFEIDPDLTLESRVFLCNLDEDGLLHKVDKGNNKLYNTIANAIIDACKANRIDVCF